MWQGCTLRSCTSGRGAVHSLRPQAWTHLHTGKEATDADLKSVLAGLSGLYIRGAYYIGAERTTRRGGRPHNPFASGHIHKGGVGGCACAQACAATS
jgi:hypothetical protein